MVIVFSFCFNICGRFSKVLWMNNGGEWTDSSWCGVMDNLPDAVCLSHLQMLSENLLLYPVVLLTWFYLLLYCASWQCKVSSKWLLLFTTLWNLTNLHYITSSLFVTYSQSRLVISYWHNDKVTWTDGRRTGEGDYSDLCEFHCAPYITPTLAVLTVPLV